MPTVIIYWSPGRTDEQKQRVVEKMTDILVEEGGADRSSVLIIFQNIEPGDAGRGGQMLNPPPSLSGQRD
ncbi:MAG: 4-oxalocrotonate tautomerase family protein [Anaerolineae bacterium]|nr:4-oxalocrotonate tautomerase family protein [Anaerolineae bacterium]